MTDLVNVKHEGAKSVGKWPNQWERANFDPSQLQTA